MEEIWLVIGSQHLQFVSVSGKTASRQALGFKVSLLRFLANLFFLAVQLVQVANVSGPQFPYLYNVIINGVCVT
jgi:hypothetical protein